MSKAEFIFHGRLNDFLDRAQREQNVIIEFKGEQSVKHLAESLGVPHPEIGEVQVNGQKEALEFITQDGDTLEIFPIPNGFDAEPRFLLDCHLGRLTAHLRALGFDCLYENDFDDPDMADIVGAPRTGDDWELNWLGNDTGWLNGTTFPTWTGNSVLTAHVTNADGLPGPFAELNKLKYGDQVIVHMGGGMYVYEIRNTRLARPYSTSFAFESLKDHSYLTLITCQVYNPLNDSYLFRRVVRAVLVSVEN